ncbi:glycosyltransferase [Kriegella sp. EG-1]|nr:glycosyltransferase [Flavobacteriaceae bacterium EG-1]
MKILYVISVLKQGKGGHYHSLNHISREVAKKQTVGLITIGRVESHIISNNPYFLSNLHFDGLNIFSLYKSLNSLLSGFKPDIIHFFDYNAYNITKVLVSNKKYSFVTNLCGGPNPYKHPKVENLVLFSRENQKWFESNPKFKNTITRLIPNRVSKIGVTSEPLVKKNKNAFCFVRIARISNFHYKSIEQTVNLFKILNTKKNSKLSLYIIGTIQDNLAYENLLTLIGKDTKITLLTDDTYTKEASKMLYLADAVIATGRGVMEAASLGLPVLTPAKNSNIPILLKASNYDNFFATNFSERNIASEKDIKANIENINKLLVDKDYYKNLSNFSLKLFEEEFDIKGATKKYNKMYQLALKNNYSVSKTSDIYLKIRTMYYFNLSRKKN